MSISPRHLNRSPASQSKPPAVYWPAEGEEVDGFDSAGGNKRQEDNPGEIESDIWKRIRKDFQNGIQKNTREIRKTDVENTGGAKNNNSKTDGSKKEIAKTGENDLSCAAKARSDRCRRWHRLG